MKNFMRRLVVMNKKIVFITGISRGIGLEIAKCFVNDGYYVIGTSRSSFSINEELNSENCIHFPIDVTDRNKISSCLEELKKINKITRNIGYFTSELTRIKQVSKHAKL